MGALLLLVAALFLTATSASAVPFTVHGYELGERIETVFEQDLWTARLDVTLDGSNGTSFGIDLDTQIDVSTYRARAVLAPHTSPSPRDEAPRDFAWAGYVMDTYGHDLGRLMVGGVTRVQAITGVHAAIWEGIYEGRVIDTRSLSDGALSVFDRIMASDFGAGLPGTSLIVELQGHQDQVFANAVPEPTAAMVFGMGLLIVSKAIRRQR